MNMELNTNEEKLDSLKQRFAYGLPLWEWSKCCAEVLSSIPVTRGLHVNQRSQYEKIGHTQKLQLVQSHKCRCRDGCTERSQWRCCSWGLGALRLCLPCLVPSGHSFSECDLVKALLGEEGRSLLVDVSICCDLSFLPAHKNNYFKLCKAGMITVKNKTRNLRGVCSILWPLTFQFLDHMVVQKTC